MPYSSWARRVAAAALFVAGVARAAGVAWIPAASDAEVDAAFARARVEARPVLLYWGAKWCPPCNQLQATVFNRQDFIERTRALVPVYVDGDKPGAQKLGTRFAVRGYPTLVLFDAQGRELTRLPGEVEPAEVGELLTLGLSARRPVLELLAQARAGGAGLTPSDWRLLAFYPWSLAAEPPPGGLAAALQSLAAACPADLGEQGDLALRLGLRAVQAQQPGHRSAGAAWPGPAADATRRREALFAVLADPVRVRSLVDLLTDRTAGLVRGLSAAGSPERARLVAALDAALQRLQDDPSLARADRVGALYARVRLVDVEADDETPVPAPPALREQVRAQAARFDREIVDAYERQAVITGSAGVLGEAGLTDDADALLKANLARSHSPFYLMADLVGQGLGDQRRPGDPAAMGRHVPEDAGRAGAAGRRAHRGAGGAPVRRGRRDAGRLRGPQRPDAAAGRRHPARLGAGKRAAGARAAPAAGTARPDLPWPGGRQRGARRLRAAAARPDAGRGA